MPTEITILGKTEFKDVAKDPKGVPSVMVTFQAADGRVGSVVIPTSAYNDARLKDEIRQWLTRTSTSPGARVTV